MPEFIVVIPARYASSRLPGKPLCDLRGKPMIQWVWERACESGARQVIVATDDDRIVAACRAFGADVEMTATAHLSGTDRLAEVAERRGFDSGSILVNVQGDEPQIPAAIIREVAAALHAHPHADIATPVAPLNSLAEFLDPNCVKAVRALDGTALYFSRAPIPWPRDQQRDGRPQAYAQAWRHIGLYAYRCATLAQIARWPPAPLEQIERLEQLRALERGLKIFLMALPYAPAGGVDTPADLENLRRMLGEG